MSTPAEVIGEEVVVDPVAGLVAVEQVSIEQRLQRAAFELTFAGKFDRVVVNDDLSTAEAEAYSIIKSFIDKP